MGVSGFIFTVQILFYNDSGNDKLHLFYVKFIYLRTKWKDSHYRQPAGQPIGICSLKICAEIIFIIFLAFIENPFRIGLNKGFR